MLITKPKAKLYIGLTRSLETKVFDKSPEKGLIFEFESLSYSEWMDLSNRFDIFTKSEEKEAASQAFREYAISKVVKIHNKDLTADQFHLDTYIPLMIALSDSSRVSEDDSFFSD